ncbi:hypothetical protein J3454_15215 [Erythrobacter sp. NFXS35]|uniref:hypothetical protein n=1 Tax=Erythrobacter sp. NFXS35 TaxID=2818436 RepID=UPI0032DEDC10
MRQLCMGIAGAAMVLAGGCAAPEQAAVTGASMPAAAAGAPVSAPGKADRVAEALMMAAIAERAQDTAALAQAMLRLDQLGAIPQTDGDAAAMERWRASVPVGTSPMRGRALGPAFRSATLRPGASTELNQTFLGGRSAQIVLRVSRGPVPRLVVHDQAERQVCLASDDPIMCRWVPLYTQRHRIEIVNIGPVQSEFYIVFD